MASSRFDEFGELTLAQLCASERGDHAVLDANRERQWIVGPVVDGLPCHTDQLGSSLRGSAQETDGFGLKHRAPLNHDCVAIATMISTGVAPCLNMQDFRTRLAQAMGFKSPEDVTGADCAKLAGEVGLTRQAIERAIAGRSKYLSAPNMSLIARHLGYDTDWLATGETRPGLSHHALRLGVALDAFPEGERAALVQQCIGVLQLHRAKPAKTEALAQPDKQPKKAPARSQARSPARSS